MNSAAINYYFYILFIDYIYAANLIFACSYPQHRGKNTMTKSGFLEITFAGMTLKD